MRLLHYLQSPAPVVAFLPADRFFTRIVVLDDGTPVESQVRLVLDEFCPFPENQIFWGFCASPDKTQAIVYAAHRRIFSAEECADWIRADYVIPELLVMATSSPGSVGTVVCLANGPGRRYGAVWTEGGRWPVALLARPVCGDESASDDLLVKALLKRVGAPSDARVHHVSGGAQAWREGRGLRLELGGHGDSLRASASLDRDQLSGVDVRDRGELNRKRADRRRSDISWAVAVTGLALGAIALICEGAGMGLQFYNHRLKDRVEQQAEEVRALDAAHTLANRIDELTVHRLLFFERLEAVNAVRPDSIIFTRSSSRDAERIDIEAQSTVVDDVAKFAKALRTAAGVNQVEVGSIRSRDGQTNFTLSLRFKPGSKVEANMLGGGAQ